jgi:hypothetical protein
MRICKKLILWNGNRKLGGIGARYEARILRLEKIREHKDSILTDIRVGHNVGDFVLDPPDFKLALVLSKYSSLHELTYLHQKYRGYTN